MRNDNVMREFKTPNYIVRTKIQCVARNTGAGTSGMRKHLVTGRRCKNWAIWRGLCKQHLGGQDGTEEKKK
jgi:hypothetical protein